MVSMKLLSLMCVSLAVLALVEAVPDDWIEAIDEGYVGVKEFATKKNVNDEVIVPDSWPTLSTFPLHHAIRKTNNPEVVKLLLSLGADVDAADSIGDTPMLRALEVNNKMIIEMLLKEGVSLDVMNNNGQTVLVKALYTGNINVLKDVLAYAEKNEIDIVNSVDGNGRTIVHLAANSGNVPAVKMLLKAGVDPEITDDNGETALFQAARNGFSAIVKLLIEAGSETINVSDKKGDTAIHEASKRGFSDIVSSLMKAGADDEARNNQGESPSDIACREPKKISVQQCVPLLRAAFKTKVLKSKDTCSCPCKSRKSGI